jgi:hypothetical protein
MTLWAIYIGWALLLATGLLARLFLGPRCVHAWELVDKTEFCSPLEEASKHGCQLKCSGDAVDRAVRRVSVVIMRCPRCGAAKVIRIES